MLAKYGCIMFTAIVQKDVLGHNFLTKAHGMMNFMSRTMFSGSRNQLVPSILMISLSVCLSVCVPVCLPVCLSVHLSIHLALHLSSNLSVGLSLSLVGRSVDLTVCPSSSLAVCLSV